MAAPNSIARRPSTSPRSWLILGSALLLGASACHGDIGDAREPGVSGGRRPSQPREDAAPDVPWAPAALLTSEQYRYAVSDLLGSHSEVELPAENRSDAFVNNARTHIASELLEERRSIFAEEAVAALSREQVFEVVGCHQCSADALSLFLRRALRRPSTESEREAFWAIVNAEANLEEGLRVLLEVILRSPQFLYRFETAAGEPTEDALAPVEDFALASRLSFFLWHSGPDESLLELAAGGVLRNEGILEAEVERMMDDPRFERTIDAFHHQWLGLGAFDGLSKGGEGMEAFTNAGPQWRRSLEAFLRGAFDDGLPALLTATDYPLTEELAQAYGFEAEAPGGGGSDADGSKTEDDGLATYAFDPETHSGLLTHPALMAKLAYNDQSSPIHRGVYVLRSFLCTELPAPPEGVDLSPPPVDPESTSRERFATLTSPAQCNGCHARINPIGFLFSHFDAAGRYATSTPTGRALDGAATVMHGELGGAYSGAADFAHALAGSRAVSDCVADHWVRFALGRPVTGEDDRTIHDVRAAFDAAGGQFRPLMKAIATSPGFRLYRSEGEAQ